MNLTESELLLTLWWSCRVSVCCGPACRSDSPTQTACPPDLRNQTTNTRKKYLVRDLMNSSASRESDTWWVQLTQRQTLFWSEPAEDERHRQTISSEHFGFLQVIFKNIASASTTIFFPTSSNFHFDQTISLQKLESNRKLFWTTIRSQTSNYLFWNVENKVKEALQ